MTYSRFGFQAATNGEYALVAAERAGDDYEVENFDALLYRRVNGAWVYQRILFSEGRDFTTDFGNFPVVIGMKGNLASAELGDPHIAIFRFDGTDWVRMGTGPGPSEDVSIDGGRLLYSVGETWNGEVFEPDGVGGWKSTLLPGQLRCCDDEFWGGPVDLLGDRAILGTPYTYDLEPQEIPIYPAGGASPATPWRRPRSRAMRARSSARRWKTRWCRCACARRRSRRARPRRNGGWA